MKYINSLIICLATIVSLVSVKPDIIISGTVVDDAGEDLIGVTVFIEGEKNGVATDIDGSFEMKVESLPVTLTFSYVGFEDEVVDVIDTKPLTVVMKEGMLLEEIVVTSVGVRKSKAIVGYGQSTVSAQRMNNVSSRKQKRRGKSANHVGVEVADMNTHRPAYDGGFCTRPTIVSENESESYSEFTENQFIRPLDEALSTFSVDVDRASYGNIRRYINGGQLPPQQAVRIEEMINYFDYDYAQPTGKDPVSIQSTLTDCPWNSEHQLLHIGLQAKKNETKNLPASNFVFLIDVSGSMHDRNKLPLIKSSMKLLVDQLRPTDRVAIVTYAGADQVVLNSTAASDKYTIMEAIDRLDAGGSTAGARGIHTAYKIAGANFMKDGNNRIILATDGDFNVGPSSNEALKTMIEQKRKSGVFLSILGYGMGNYQDDIMQTLAQAGNGNHSYIDDLQEAQKTLVNEFGGTLFTVAKDVKIQIEFNPGKVSAYRLVGYETRMLAKEDFNNDKKDAGDMGSGHSVTAIYEVIPVGSKSTYFGNVDELKYQKKKKSVTTSTSDDIATIKFRYKQPDSDTSKKVEVVINKFTTANNVSDDANWAIATATFGMKLRGSDFIDDLEYDQIITLAKRSRGADNEGYRSEMIRLMKSAKGLSSEYLIAEK